MKQPLLIGLGHQRLRGKDTVADYIIRKHARIAVDKEIQDHYVYGNDRDRWMKACFAHNLKKGIGQGVFGLNRHELYVDKEGLNAYWDLTPRTILQRAGSVLRQEFGPDVWVRSLMYTVTYQLKVQTNIVISDVRFKDEAVAIKALGGTLIRLDRDIPHDARYDTHESERDLLDFSDWDYVIDNNGSLYDLYHRVDTVIYGIQNRQQQEK